MNTIKQLFRLSSKLVHDPAPPLVECAVSFETLCKNADMAVRNSEQARSTLHKFADLWCKNSKAKLDPDNAVVMGPTKSKDRFIEKAVARYNGDVFQVSDGCRNRILIDDPSQVKMMKAVINSPQFVENCESKGIKITSVEDLFEKPTATGYRALVVKTEIDLGKGRSQLAETVIMPRGWTEEYETTHVYLEQIRTLKDLAKAQNRENTPHESSIISKHTQEAKEIHSYLAMIDGYDELELNKPGKTRMPKPSVPHLS